MTTINSRKEAENRITRLRAEAVNLYPFRFTGYYGVRYHNDNGTAYFTLPAKLKEQVTTIKGARSGFIMNSITSESLMMMYSIVHNGNDENNGGIEVIRKMLGTPQPYIQTPAFMSYSVSRGKESQSAIELMDYDEFIIWANKKAETVSGKNLIRRISPNLHEHKASSSRINFRGGGIYPEDGIPEDHEMVLFPHIPGGNILLLMNPKDCATYTGKDVEHIREIVEPRLKVYRANGR